MQTHLKVLPIGAPAPGFELPGVDGKSYALKGFTEPVLVYIQSCNHCPYVLAYLKRLKDLAKDYSGKGVQFLMVNSNDAAQYPEDDFEHMKGFAQKHELPFPYLYDETQAVAKAYRTYRTPEVLVFDEQRKLVYHGRIDDSAKEPHKVSTHEFKDALDALLSGQAIKEAETSAVGCTVKWKPGNESVIP